MKLSMKTFLPLSAAFCGPAILIGLVCLGITTPALAYSGLAGQVTPQALLQPSEAPAESSGDAMAGADAKEDSQYSEGTRAIRESRWADAESIFGKLAEQHGEHSEGALYWKAYAENRQGHADSALKTCANLHNGYPHSRWIEECNALEMDIHGGKGQPGKKGKEQDETLKLHAIDALMDKNEPRALDEIQTILNSDQPENFKERTLFLLVESSSKQARQMLIDASNSAANPALQARARQILATIQGQPAQGKQLAELANAPLRHRIGIDAVVTDSNGKPVSGLTMQDFTLFDNNQPRKIEVLESSTPTPSRDNDNRAQVLIVIDAVNTALTDVSYVRQQMVEFLGRNDGKLDRPVSILLFNGNGVQKLGGPTRDGTMLMKAVQQADVSLHPFRRSQGFYGDVERIQFSLDALNSIAIQQFKQPGRTMILWLCPGWPLLPWANSTPTQQQLDSIFGQVVGMSTNLRLAHISLYSMDPNRMPDSMEWNRYKDYLKPATSSKRVEMGNLALQVLATQTGGRALNFSNRYLSEEIADTLTDADATFYTFHFNAPVAAHKDEFHSLKVAVNKPGLTVHTNVGYYNQP